VRCARSTATLGGVCTAIFAGLTLLLALAWFSWPAILVGVGLGIVAVNSFRGLHGLRQLSPAAPRLLGFNQLFLACCLILYALWSLYQYSHSPAPFADVLASEP